MAQKGCCACSLCSTTVCAIKSEALVLMADMATPNRKGCLLAGHSGAVSQDIANWIAIDVNRSLAWHLDALPPCYRDPRYPQIAIEFFGKCPSNPGQSCSSMPNHHGSAWPVNGINSFTIKHQGLKNHLRVSSLSQIRMLDAWSWQSMGLWHWFGMFRGIHWHPWDDTGHSIFVEFTAIWTITLQISREHCVRIETLSYIISGGLADPTAPKGGKLAQHLQTLPFIVLTAICFLCTRRKKGLSDLLVISSED